MKDIIKLTFVFFLVVSCGGDKTQSVEDLIASNDLEQLRAKKAELDAQQQDLTSQIKQLQDKIKELDPQEKIPLITTFTTKQEPFHHFVELQGSVDTKQNLVIYPEYSGVLTKVYVKEGQKVSKGQILAKIDDGGLSQQVAQLQIQADLAKTTFERQKRLWDQKIGSEIQYLQAKSNYEAQEKAVKQLKEQIGKTAVRAPFSGTIDDVITEQGSVVSPGQSQLFRIVNLRDMYIETDVPESYITSITNGKDVKVEFPILGSELNAKVRQAGNFINPANRTFRIEVAVPNKDNKIKPNLTAKLKINDYTNESAILIPQSIISENAEGKQYVYTITDKKDNKGKAKRVFIETGKTQGDYIEVLSGLENGNEIVDEGARSVKDGQEVKILVVE
ncbi:MAG: efflux RND transporter periplasmic adaptor subunit [Bacteroidota bacterium]